MSYIVGVLLMLVGLATGLIGERIMSYELLMIGGFLIAAGVATILLSGSGRGGRHDEPNGHIRP